MWYTNIHVLMWSVKVSLSELLLTWGLRVVDVVWFQMTIELYWKLYFSCTWCGLLHTKIWDQSKLPSSWDFLFTSTDATAHTKSDTTIIKTRQVFQTSLLKFTHFRKFMMYSTTCLISIIMWIQVKLLHVLHLRFLCFFRITLRVYIIIVFFIFFVVGLSEVFSNLSYTLILAIKQLTYYLWYIYILLSFLF